MIKKIIALLVVVVYSCGSASKVRTTTNVKKPTTTVKKPMVQTKPKPVEGKSEVLEATSRVGVTTEVVKRYIEQFKSTAQDNMRNHGIPSSITMAQGILESGAGTGVLSMKANNHFGIKCHTGWTGESVRHDDEPVAFK